MTMTSEKIQSRHLDRIGYVYVRQSTMHQVRNNLESQRRQYALSERARALGFREVKVIDDDLGRSGSGAKERPGFARLVAAVCAGEAGGVLALEASRLARNNRDWHHLIDLCAMTDTLVIDHDGVYDPRQLNDRLLLGLKGTMSEFELNLLRQRAQESLRQMIQRGEVLWSVPIGYVRTENNGIEMTPDLRVQDAIRGVFSKFMELGSVRQVLLWYHQNRLPLPVFAEDGGRQVVWRPPVYGRLHKVLTNPAYAGTFAYGRHQTQTKVVDGRARKSAGHTVPLEQWQVLIQDHHPGYISWETYVRNRSQIKSNGARDHRSEGSGTGAAKSGSAMLTGLLRCARCGRKLRVNYCGVGGRVARYYCGGANLSRGEAPCISVGSLRLDQAVETKVLEALQPMGVQAALNAWGQIREQEDQKQQTLRLAIEQARYEAERIRRQYDATEPENRLVTAELERRWEQALHRTTELETQLSSAQNSSEELSEAERDRLLELGEDLKEVWNHPGASAALKKRILRTVLQEVMVDIIDEPPRVRLLMHWAGGIHTETVFPRNRTGQHRRSTDQEVVELVRELAQVCDDTSIAAILNRLGYRTGMANTWIESRVRALRSHHKIPSFDAATPRNWLTLDQTATELNVSRHAVRNLLTKKILPGRQIVPSAPWVIQRKDTELPDVQAAVDAIRDGRKAPCPADDESQIQLFQR